jgi:hypothetical protein
MQMSSKTSGAYPSPAEMAEWEHQQTLRQLQNITRAVWKGRLFVFRSRLPTAADLHSALRSHRHSH